MKILYIINSREICSLSDQSPTNRRSNNLMVNLADMDMDTRCLDHPERVKKGLVANLFNHFYRAIGCLRLIPFILREKPLVIAAYPNVTRIFEYKLLYKFSGLVGCDKVLDVQDTREQSGLNDVDSPISVGEEERMLRRAEVLLVVSKRLQNHLVDIYHLDLSKMVIVPNAFDDEMLSIFHEPYSFSNSRMNICYLGIIGKHRGHEEFFEGYKLAMGKNPLIKLFLFGSVMDDFHTEVEELMHTHLDVTCEYIPFSKLYERIMDVDLFVLPYRSTNPYIELSSPIKFFDYLGTGKPIISTKCAFLKDLDLEDVVHQVDLDPRKIEEAIEYLVDHPETMNKMASKAREVRKDHTWKSRARIVRSELLRRF